MDNPESVLGLIKFSGLPFAVLAVIGTWMLARASTRFFTDLGERFADRRLLFNQISTILQFTIYLFGTLLAATLGLRLNDDVLLGLTGTIAVTVGFALKDLAASVIAGVVIVLDRPFQVGDRVTFGGQYGEITAIGLRSVRLVTLDDSVVSIPTNKFLTDAVTSGNWGALDMLVQVDFHVAIDEDLARVRPLVEAAVTSSPYVYTRKPWVVLVSEVLLPGGPAWRFRTKAYVLDVQLEKAYESDLSERVSEQFVASRVRRPAYIVQSMSECA